MVPVDSENSTAMPARTAGDAITAGLARQTHEREKALRRVAKLRLRASDEIERLLNFLDASDPYATELEDQVDDRPCDTDELEQGWTGLTANAGNMPNLDWIDESEGDGTGSDADAEPSLGSVASHESAGQCGWAAQGAADDREEEETDDDTIAEPSMGWPERDSQRVWEDAAGDYCDQSGELV